MKTEYETDSPEALTAIAAPEPKSVWIHGSTTYIATGSDLPPPPSAQDQIIALEAQVTQRMLRESALGIDGGKQKLAEIDDKITALAVSGGVRKL